VAGRGEDPGGREDVGAAGRRLWGELHRFAASWEGDRAVALAWLADFRSRLPSGSGCACRAGWDEAIAADPPDLSSAQALMAWGWRIHNRINVKLDKPAVGWDEAARQWGWPESDQA
jgi:hypothetical protein